MHGLKKGDPMRWWRDVKEITGLKKEKCDSLQGMANSLCNCNVEMLAKNICQAFQAVNENMTPITINDNLQWAIMLILMFQTTTSYQSQRLKSRF